MRQTGRDWQIAVHEAGHAVMAWLLKGLDDSAVVAIDDAESSTETGRMGVVCEGQQAIQSMIDLYSDVDCSSSEEERLQQVGVEIQILLAGVVAGKVWCGRHNWTGARSDLLKRDRLLDTCWPDDRELQNAYNKYLMAKVRHDLTRRPNQRLVEAVANALVEGRVLSGKQVITIISAQYGGEQQ